MDAPSMAGWNLTLRFGLEVVALVALGIASWKLGSGSLRWVLVAGLPLVAAVAWTIFNVPGDPSRSGEAPVEVAGWTRLVVEIAVLGAGAVALWFAVHPAVAVGYVGLVVVQYVTSLDRVRWVVEHELSL